MGVKPAIIKASALKSYDIKGVHQGLDYVATPDVPEFSITQINRLKEKPASQANQNICWYVLEGQGEFELNGEKHLLAKGDMMIAAQGSTYNTPAGVKLLAIANPRFQ